MTRDHEELRSAEMHEIYFVLSLLELEDMGRDCEAILVKKKEPMK